MSTPDTDPRLQKSAQRLRQKLAQHGVSRSIVDAMAGVPRHEFVPDDVKDKSYEDVALPIGYDQTISQPTLVAKMTDLLALHRLCRVLEIGTGCGYQTAILAELASQVFSIELEEALFADARTRLRQLGYRNIETRLGDGYSGWAESAPFDAIIVTASAPHVPAPLVAQLKPGGRLVIPVARDLMLIAKDADGRTSEKFLGNVTFVPLRRG